MRCTVVVTGEGARNRVHVDLDERALMRYIDLEGPEDPMVGFYLRSLAMISTRSFCQTPTQLQRRRKSLSCERSLCVHKSVVNRHTSR